MWRIRHFLVSVGVAMVATVSAAEWGTNYEAALVQAREQGKPVLVDFTGSDWCYYCIQLRRTVLECAPFAEWAEENFVLLEVDVPQNPQFDSSLLERNRELCARYRVEVYPTVLVLDAQGRPLGGFSGYEGNPDTVRAILADGIKADELLRRAEAHRGELKLEAMLAAWKLIPTELQELNDSLRQELMTIDKQDKSGLRAAAEAEDRLQKCVAAAAAAPTDAAALQIVEAALARAVPQNRRQLLEMKYRLLFSSLQTPEDVYAAAEVAYAMIDADLRLTPEVKESRKQQLRGVFANPQTSINRSRMLRRKRPIR